MPILTVDVPEARYVEALRLFADFLASGDGRDATPAGDAAARLSASAAETADRKRPWSVAGTEPDEESDDFGLLVDYYRRLSATARRILDALLAESRGLSTADLTAQLGLDSSYALSGSVGHTAKLAGEFDRPTPIHLDKHQDRYWVEPELVEPLRQARLWSVRAPYLHRYWVDGQTYERELDIPNRFMVIKAGDKPTEATFFPSRDEAFDFHDEVFDEYEPSWTTFEFAPDHANGELVALDEPPHWEPGQ